MRKFILQLSKQFGIIFLFYVLLSYTVPGFPPSVGEEVDYAQYLAQNTKLKPGDTVRIGDSVGKNINPEQGYKDNTLNLCSNNGISLLGQLLLLQQVLNNAENSESIYIEGYLLPNSFFNNLTGKLSSNYFIKKFYTRSWLFNPELLKNTTTDKFDTTILFPYRQLGKAVKFTTINNKTPLDFYPISLNRDLNEPTENILSIILKDEILSKLFKRIHFQKMPIPQNQFNYKMTFHDSLIKMGVNIPTPILLNDTFFNGTHLRGKYKKRSFYDKIITYNKNDN